MVIKRRFHPFIICVFSSFGEKLNYTMHSKIVTYDLEGGAMEPTIVVPIQNITINYTTL